MNIPTHHTGDDWPLTVVLYLDNVAANVASASAITVSVIASDHSAIVVGPVTASSGTTGASWTSGVVVATISAASTGSITPGRYRVEVQVTQAGSPVSWSDSMIDVVRGNNP